MNKTRQEPGFVGCCRLGCVQYTTHRSTDSTLRANSCDLLEQRIIIEARLLEQSAEHSIPLDGNQIAQRLIDTIIWSRSNRRNATILSINRGVTDERG